MRDYKGFTRNYPTRSWEEPLFTCTSMWITFNLTPGILFFPKIGRAFEVK